MEILNQKNFRVVSKNRAGYFSILEEHAESPLQLLKRYKPKYVFLMEEEDSNLKGCFRTIFAVKGNRIIFAPKDILESGLVERYWPKTDINTLLECPF